MENLERVLFHSLRKLSQHKYAYEDTILTVIKITAEDLGICLSPEGKQEARLRLEEAFKHI